jgi:non-heme chloroperoxidase
MKSFVFLTLFVVSLVPATKAQNAELEFEKAAMSAMALKPEVKFAKLSNGITLEYAEQGDPSGMPVIFLHGISDSWRSFELNLPLLPSSIHAFSLSQRGHGNSDKPAKGYSPKDFADDVAAFMDNMKLKKAIIVGHSMGSTNARQFVISYPERTMGLVLIGSFASFDNNPVIKEFEGILAQLQDPIDKDFIAEFQKSTIKRPIPDTYLETVIDESQKLPAHVWKGVAIGWKKIDFTEGLKKLNLPTLIIWGDLDAYCPKGDQYLLGNTIRNSRLEIYKGTGHAVHWEEPQRFVDDLVAFIGEIKY